ncbi:MAG: hypothetical protein HY689_16355 [Chloroflexi bacterium]|nr:hypothetical protein [Chloroflexota bacterium]
MNSATAHPIGTTSPEYVEKGTLLVVLQDDWLAQHFMALLRHAGYAVLPAVSPDDACGVLARQDVSLALVDVAWGPGEVAQVAEAARRAPRPCPVGVIVGWWDERVSEVYHMTDLLVYKPPTERQLLAAVESAVARHGLSA